MSQPTPDKCYSLPRSIAVQIKFIDLQVEFTSTGCVDWIEDSLSACVVESLSLLSALSLSSKHWKVWEIINSSNEVLNGENKTQTAKG